MLYQTLQLGQLSYTFAYCTTKHFILSILDLFCFFAHCKMVIQNYGSHKLQIVHPNFRHLRNKIDIFCLLFFQFCSYLFIYFGGEIMSFEIIYDIRKPWTLKRKRKTVHYAVSDFSFNHRFQCSWTQVHLKVIHLWLCLQFCVLVAHDIPPTIPPKFGSRFLHIVPEKSLNEKSN